jgi:putative heme-binding domain-containing protein
MRSAVCAALLLALVVTVAPTADKPDRYAGHIAATPPRTPEEERRLFQLPEGFEAQLVAAEPDIHKPLNIAFDDRGRLWVSDTLEYPYAASADKKPRDTVKILDDFGPDGRARKVTTFADGLNIPIGVLPLGAGRAQGALVFSIPSIYRMTDSKNRGLADQRQVLYTEYGSRDTHGMTSAFTWGFDGWVYACHGFSNTSTIKAADGSSVTMHSGNTYRIRPDGSHIESFTHGQVNPFGLCFDPLGDLYSADCHTQPAYLLLRDAHYPSFGKPHDGLGFGPEMVRDYRDSTAIAGCCYYAADHFPTPFQGSLFIGDVVTRRIVQFRLDWRGSSPWGNKEYFLKSEDPWFRPVDIKLGPDGALYVADFYNRIIGHYEVPLDHPGRDRERGRIWRIVYRGPNHQGTRAPRTDWTTATVEELLKDLGHPNLTVRFKATNQLCERGSKEVIDRVNKLLLDDKNPASAWQWMHGLWVLHRQNGLASAVLTRAAQHKDRGVRVHAQHVLGERDKLLPGDLRLLWAALQDSDPFVQRAAADALGRHPAVENIPHLLDLRHAVPGADTHLLHTVRMALRDQLQPLPTWTEANKTWSGRDEQAVADVALGVPTPAAAAYLEAYLRRHPQTGDTLTSAVHHIARYAAEPVTPPFLGFVRQTGGRDLGRQVALFRAVERGVQERGRPLDPPVRTWGVELCGRLLASKKASAVQAGIELVGSLKVKGHQDRLTELARRRSTPEGQRKAALDALAALDVARHAAVLGEVLADGRSPSTLREQSANLLARANQPPTREELVKVLPAVPAQLQSVIATGLAGTPQGAEKLLAAVQAGKASARLLQDRAVALRLTETHLPHIEERIAELTRSLPPPEKGIQDLLKRRQEHFLKAKTDVAAGARAFTKNCAICHQIGGQGARIGPQLDGIGVRGVDRLLEDTLDPNRNVDQAFRLTTVNLKNGQVVSGLLLKEEGAVLVLADNQGKEVRVAQDAVEERSMSPLSPMPANFATAIAEPEFYDLLAFLLSQQANPKDQPTSPR